MRLQRLVVPPVTGDSFPQPQQPESAGPEWQRVGRIKACPGFLTVTVKRTPYFYFFFWTHRYPGIINENPHAPLSVMESLTQACQILTTRARPRAVPRQPVYYSDGALNSMDA